MVRPRYLICCESRIVDRATGLITHYNVLDELSVTIAASKAQTAAMPLLKFVMTSVWMRETEDEPEDTYEFETYMHVPGEEEARCIHKGQFQFGQSRSYRLEVFVQGVAVQGDDSATKGGLRLISGDLRLESRVRRCGDERWLLQDCVVPVRVEQMTPELAESSPDDAPE